MVLQLRVSQTIGLPAKAMHRAGMSLLVSSAAVRTGCGICHVNSTTAVQQGKTLVGPDRACYSWQTVDSAISATFMFTSLHLCHVLQWPGIHMQCMPYDSGTSE